MDRGDRTALNNLRKSLALDIIQQRGFTRRLAVEEPIWTSGMNRTTQSRTICSVTPPIRAAWLRLLPSYFSAKARSLRP